MVPSELVAEEDGSAFWKFVERMLNSQQSHKTSRGKLVYLHLLTLLHSICSDPYRGVLGNLSCSKTTNLFLLVHPPSTLPLTSHLLTHCAAIPTGTCVHQSIRLSFSCLSVCLSTVCLFVCLFHDEQLSQEQRELLTVPGHCTAFVAAGNMVASTVDELNSLLRGELGALR